MAAGGQLTAWRQLGGSVGEGCRSVLLQLSEGATEVLQGVAGVFPLFNAWPNAWRGLSLARTARQKLILRESSPRDCHDPKAMEAPVSCFHRAPFSFASISRT